LRTLSSPHQAPTSSGKLNPMNGFIY